MSAAARVLAVWLTPALWLGMPTLILEHGPDGLWMGLSLTLTPLIAAGMWGSAGEGQEERRPLLSIVVLFVVVAIVLWANIVLAGDVAMGLGAPRWYGVGAASVGGVLLTAWRGSGRVVPALLVAALVGASLPLADLVLDARAGPLAAWARVASQPAFRFSPGSPWVTSGKPLALAGGRAPIVLDEEHRVTTSSGGVLRARSIQGRRVTESEWTLAPGQSVTLRPGDQLDRASTLELRFEAGKRVPGAPASGMAWAAGWELGWAQRAGAHLTLLLGGMVLLWPGAVAPPTRRLTLLLAGGLLAAFLWAQGWAIYAALGAPDLFLGGITSERLADLRWLAYGAEPWKRMLQPLFLAAGLASFLASSAALREWLGALDRAGVVGHDLGLWAGVFGVGGLASLWPVEPWWLLFLALGIGAAGLGPSVLWPGADSRAVTASGVIGLALFAAFAFIGELRSATPEWARGLPDAVLAYPALGAAPVGAVALWLCRRPRRRR